MSVTSIWLQPGLALGFVLGGLSACQTAPPSGAESVQPSASPVASEAATNAESAEASASAAASAEPPVAPAEVVPTEVDTRVRDACAKLCARKAQACSTHDAEICAAECAGRELKSKGCEAKTEAALLCQVEAKQSPCNNVAAGGCTEAFLQMQRCQRGETPPEQASSKSGLPTGWANTKDESWGVSIAMPPGAELDTKAKSRMWKASFEGAQYEVIELARPKELNDNALIKLVIAHVGVSCQKEMRLTGRVEREHLMFTRFETSCGKGERIFGKLRVDDKRALSMVVRGPAKPEQRTAFFESVN